MSGANKKPGGAVGAPAGRGGRFDARAARSSYNLRRQTKEALPSLAVRGDRFADLCEALGLPCNAALSDARRYRAGRRGSFCADLQTGRWFCHETSKGGAVVELLLHTGVARDFQEAVAWLRAGAFVAADPARDEARAQAFAEAQERDALAAEAKRRKALAIWSAALPITPDTLAGRYLLARAIAAPWPPSLRFAPRLWNSEARAYLPAMVAAVAPLGTPEDVRAIQRTWLAEPGRKAELATPKAALGAIGGCGVALGEIADAVVIAEGVESALSASAALGLPGVAALGCANLRRLALPDRVRRVVIAPDRDASGAGERAARELGRALIARGISAALAWPPQGFADWNDAAQAGAIDGGAA
jgi:hypothetical protein